jgi:vacuolar-type H+-ATPase subunit I/STV1
MITLDEQQEKQDRLEFLTATAGFLEKAIQAPPELTPLLGELLLFGVRSFKAGDQMEGAIENAVKQLTAPKPPQQPQPDPQMMVEQGRMQLEQVKMQMAQQTEQAKAQMDAAKAQSDSQLAFAKMEQEKEIKAAQMAHEERMAELARAHELQMEQMKQQGEDGRTSAKLEVDSQTKIRIAEMALEQKESLDLEEIDNQDPVQAMADMHGEMLGQIGELAKVMAAPRTRKLVRGKDGKAEQMIETIEN